MRTSTPAPAATPSGVDALPPKVYGAHPRSPPPLLQRGAAPTWRAVSTASAQAAAASVFLSI